MGTRLQLEKRRKLAIEMLQAGKSYRFVAKTLNSSTSSVVRWQKTFKQKGLEGLKSKPNLGRPSQLTNEQKTELFNDLLQGACKAGYSSELWTLKRITEHVQKKFNISYESSSMWRLLNNENWSWQKPEKRAIQRNEEAIENWKKESWVDIKKSPKS